MVRAIYPGTFDPITRGHADVARRAARIFDELVVAVGTNPAKEPLFPLAERLAMVRAELADLPSVRIESFEGLLVAYARSVGARVLVRGARNVADFEYELRMAMTNRALAPELETVLVLPSAEYVHVNAQLIREIATFGGPLDAFVSPQVEAALRRRLVGKSAGGH